MTAIQLNALNAQIQENIGLLSDSETLMKRLAKYVSKTCQGEGRSYAYDEGGIL